MQQSKRVFRLYIWRNQGSVCIVDAVAIKGVEMGGSLVGIEGMGSRRGSANIWGRLPSLLLIHPAYCSTLSSVRPLHGLPSLLLIQGVIGWLEVGSPDRDPGS